MAVDDVFRVAISSKLLQQRIVTVLYFRRRDALPYLLGDFTSILTDWKEAHRTDQVDDFVYETQSSRQVRGGLVTRDPATCKILGGIVFESPAAGIVTGSDVADPLPPQDTIVVTLKTGQAGRSRRGRTFMAGYSENFQTAGTIPAALVTQLTTNIQVFFAKYGFGGTSTVWEWGVWSETIASGCKPDVVHPHKRKNFLVGAPSAAFAPITEFVVRNTIRSQRRRQLGVGA